MGSLNAFERSFSRVEQLEAAAGKVAEAEQAAHAKDSSKVAESLKAAGEWALDVATKIGTAPASEALKESMGMK